MPAQPHKTQRHFSSLILDVFADLKIPQVTDVSSQEEVVRTLLSAIDKKALPHLLFYGPPGTGKTSTALALCQALYGPQLYKSRILEMNASDERGIKVRNPQRTLGSDRGSFAPSLRAFQESGPLSPLLSPQF